MGFGNPKSESKDGNRGLQTRFFVENIRDTRSRQGVMSNTVRGSRPWLCDYLVQCLERDSQPPGLNGKYAQVLMVNAASREMVVFDGEYSAQALLTEEAADELKNDGSGISVQGLMGRTLAPVDIIVVQELNLVPPSVTLIIKKMKVFPDSMSHRPVRDPPFAAAAPLVLQKLRALHLEQITMPVPEVPAPGSELIEQLGSEADSSDSPPRSVRLEPCPIPEKPSGPAEGNAPCLRFADVSNDGGKNRGHANDGTGNEDDSASTVELDEEEHSNALHELTSSLRMHSPPPLGKSGNDDVDVDMNGMPAETQAHDSNSVSNTQKLPMTQFDQTEDMDEDESDTGEAEVEKENTTNTIAKSTTYEEGKNDMPPSAEGNADVPMEEKQTNTTDKEEKETKEKPSNAVDDVDMIVEQKQNGLADNEDVDMAVVAPSPPEDTIMGETNDSVAGAEVRDTADTTEEPSIVDKREGNGEKTCNQEDGDEEEKLARLLIEDEALIAKVSGLVDNALRLLDGMTKVDGPWEITS